MWAGIAEMGCYTFDLAIKSTQINSETGEEEEVVIGYMPQSMETAHELLKNLSGKDCNFKSVNFQVV